MMPEQPPQAPARGDVGKFIAEARAAIVRLETGRPEWSPTADLLERLAAALAAAQPERINNRVACVNCKQPVDVTARNAIRCERCKAAQLPEIPRTEGP